MFLILTFKNILSRKSSFVIALFIAFSVAVMVFINSVFDSTENGIEKVYSRSFTGDFVIRPVSDYPLSLFGDETPVTGDLTKINTVIPYGDIIETLRKNDSVSEIFSQVSGRAMVELNGVRELESLFGVSASDYVKCMSAISIIEGRPFSSDQRGVMVSEKIAEKFGAKVGDKMQFTVVSGTNFRIRAAEITAIYSYPVYNQVLERIILVDPGTLRSLVDMSESVIDESSIDEEARDLLDIEMNLDSVFDEYSDVSVEQTFFDDSSLLAPTEVSNDHGMISAESNSWNFVVGNVKDGESVRGAVNRLNSFFKKSQWPVQAVLWRSAAGSSAMYIYWMRIIFNAGVIVVLFAGFIIINNTLVVNVLNRTQEIGTMRAEGASRFYVSAQCMAETFIVAVVAGIFGCILGTISVGILSSASISINNELLVQLFGSDVLDVSVSAAVLLKAMVLSMIIGILGWIYPVRTALSVSPVNAMSGASV